MRISDWSSDVCSSDLYAVLVVHRSLVRSYRLGDGALTDHEAEAMEVTGELISTLERRAMEAERDTLDRYVAAYLSTRVGDLFDCRINGVQPFAFLATVVRSEERRIGKARVSPFRPRRTP